MKLYRQHDYRYQWLRCLSYKKRKLEQLPICCEYYKIQWASNAWNRNWQENILFESIKDLIVFLSFGLLQLINLLIFIIFCVLFHCNNNIIVPLKCYKKYWLSIFMVLYNLFFCYISFLCDPSNKIIWNAIWKTIIIRG